MQQFSLCEVTCGLPEARYRGAMIIVLTVLRSLMHRNRQTRCLPHIMRIAGRHGTDLATTTSTNYKNGEPYRLIAKRHWRWKETAFKIRSKVLQSLMFSSPKSMGGESTRQAAELLSDRIESVSYRNALVICVLGLLDGVASGRESSRFITMRQAAGHH